MNAQKIQDVLTQICDLGCARIRLLIEALESEETGAALRETKTLNSAERQAVLAELKSIMAIYDLRK